MGAHRYRSRLLAAITALGVVAVVASSCTATPPAPQVTPPPSDGHRPRALECALPAAGHDFRRAAPEELGLDRDALLRAVDYAGSTGATSYRVYRRGCLAADGGTDPTWSDRPMASFSMTKSVVSLVVGRAVAMGLLDVDDPVGPYLRRAGVEVDDVKGALTVRHFLTQTTGVRMPIVSDFLEAFSTDSVRAFLERPFEAVPGTTFIYAQTAVSALAVVVEGAVGRDFQDFARDELFRRVGIQDRDWTWARDPAGNTQGFAFLDMSPQAFARLGVMAGEGGRWRGRQLIDAWYLDEAQDGAATNPCYGFLIRSNRSARCGSDGIPAAQVFDRRFIPPAPVDTFGFSGAFDQETWIVPSLDMVVVRMGGPSFLATDPLGASGDLFGPAWKHRSMQLLMQAVRDVPQPAVPDWTPDPPAPTVELARLLPLPLPEPWPR